jgi:hypothetical protein
MPEISQLRALLAEGKTVRQAAEILERSFDSVTHVMWRLKIRKYTDDRFWTEEQEEFLIENPAMPVADIARHLGRSYRSIIRKRKKLSIGTHGGPRHPTGIHMSEDAMLASLDRE